MGLLTRAVGQNVRLHDAACISCGESATNAGPQP
ncbi:hypothetical protein Gotur_004718 [Gossypium turneri]